MTPRVGQMVRYTSCRPPTRELAALVTAVEPRDDEPPARLRERIARLLRPEPHFRVDLRIFHRTGEVHELDVPFAPAPPGSADARGCWCW